MDRPLVFVDTETATCRGAPHLLEVGALRVVDGEVVDEFAELVRPEVPIEPEASEIHGLSDDDVTGADPAAAVLGRFLDWLGADWAVAHDAPKDARVVGFECLRAGLGAPEQPWLCTLRLGRKLVPEAPSHRLHDLLEHLELDGAGEGPRHRALADAAWCFQLFGECVERAGGWAATSAAELLARAGSPVTVPGFAPRPPARLKPRLRALAEACTEGRAVELLYGEGADEPALLPVVPRLLYQEGGRAYLEGECGSSGLLKTYRLDRVQRVLAD